MTYPCGRGRRGRFRTVLALLLAGLTLLGGRTGLAQVPGEEELLTGAPAPTTEPAAPAPVLSHQPVTLDLVVDYLKRWGLENFAADRDDQHVRFKLQQVNRRMPALDCFIQVRMKRDGLAFDRLYIGFLDLANVPAGHPRLLDVLKTLVTLNWQNAIGKYSWDETDGEIRLEYTVVANEGLCYADFADVLNRLALTADGDRPTIQRPIWGKG